MFLCLECPSAPLVGSSLIGSGALCALLVRGSSGRPPQRVGYSSVTAGFRRSLHLDLGLRRPCLLFYPTPARQYYKMLLTANAWSE